jgi:hypothetical protein
MKLFNTLVLILIVSVSAMGQSKNKHNKQKPFQLRAYAGFLGTFDYSYNQTSIDLNGVKLTAMGTADNLISITQQTGSVISQLQNIVSGHTSVTEVWKEGDVTYYRYGDDIITEEKKRARSASAIVGLEGGMFLRPISAAVGLRNSKYRYIAPDFYFRSKLSPWILFVQAREALSGFTYQYPDFYEWIGLFHFGYQAGWDGGMPGFMNFDERAYKGFMLSLGSTVKRTTWSIEGFLQNGGKHMELNQSNLSVIIQHSF